ncbi:MAG: SpoIID/LytB domain-containing protein [Muribaculaceae bacterium]|nr:SpoIID/LytB domain-containing protein [Muribaculaceae bacterium]
MRLTREPQVQVGIMTSRRISVVFHGGFRCGADVVSGRMELEMNADGLIPWNGSACAELLFEPLDNGSVFDLEDVTIGVSFHWERRETQRFRGSLRMLSGTEGITAVNVVGVEEYLLSVISSEMSATASPALLRAHAVISRSWLLAQMAETRTLTQPSECAASQQHAGCDEIIRWYDRDDHDRFDVCADDHCQRYQGVLRQTTPAVAEAVAATRGQVLMYGGYLCDARFSKCCGGAMELFENCWEPVGHPYIQARRDSIDPSDLPDLTSDDTARSWILGSPGAYCNTSDPEILSQVLNDYDRETSDFYRWRVEYTQQELAGLLLRRSGIDFGSIIDLVPLARGTSGRIYRLSIRGTLRSVTVGKELEIRKWLSESHLYSSAFVVERSGMDADGIPARFVLHGAGWGHGAGLCQIGAAVMGAKGIPYDRILMHYFPGSSIETLY